MQDREKDLDSDREPFRITIVGAGITGLTAAYRLTRQEFLKDTPVKVLLLDGSAKAGGAICSYELEDYLLELGPDMFQTEKPEALNLCRELGLGEYIISTNESCRRTFVAHDGSLHPLPDGFQMLAPTRLIPFASSSLLSMRGKMRMAMDLIIPPKTDGAEESLAQFVRRRFGQEALERIAQPMIGGVYTADPERLSLSATMPRFIEMEKQYGSVIRGLIAKGESTKSRNHESTESGCRYGMFVSLKRGMSMLVNSLISALPPDCLHVHCPVISVEKGSHGKAYDVIVNPDTIVPSDAVILSGPAYASAKVLKPLNESAAGLLEKIPYSSCAILNLIYNRSDIPHPLDGFGFVVPSIERRNILACSFASVKFPERCPENKAVLRVFVGGALQPDVFKLTDEQIECLIWEDLRNYLGLRSVPLLSVITRYPRSMPQYHIGHLELVGSIKTELKGLPGIELAGSAYEGVGIPDCIRSGEAAAARVLNMLVNSEAALSSSV